MSANSTRDVNEYEPNRPITAREAAEMVGVSIKTIHNWIETGKIPGYLHGYDRVVVDQDDIEPLMGYRRITPKVNVKVAHKKMTDALAAKEEDES